jgi:hypothetical protein
MDNERFTLRWDRPFLPDASTHVSLFDGGSEPLHIVASGHGADDTSALRDLWRTLKERHESAAAIAYVAEEYAALTGNAAPRSR